MKLFNFNTLIRTAFAMLIFFGAFLSVPLFAQVGSGPDLSSPGGIAIEADGNLVVIDNNLVAVFRVDPISGDRTILSDASTGSGPVFGSPIGIAIEADGSLVVTDFDLDAVFRVDPVSGDRTILSDASNGSGPNFGFPFHIAVEADGSLVVAEADICLLYTSPSPRDATLSRMPSSA